MTVNDFVIKWQGKPLDFDGVYGPQCVDLARQYLIECLQFPNSCIKPVVGAKDMYEKYDTLVDKTYFDRIPNTPTGVPKEGDIILWGNSTYGHVAVFIEGDANSFRSFDQNYPVGSVCHVQTHTSYKNVLGWLTPKTLNQQAEIDSLRLERDRNWTWFTQVCDALGVGANVDAAVNEAKKLVGNDDVLVQKDKAIKEAQTEIADLKLKVGIYQDENAKLALEASTLTSKATELEKKYQQSIINYEDALAKIHILEETMTKPEPKGWQKIIDGFLELIRR